MFLKLEEIEAYANKFYGIEKRLKKKSDRKARQEEYFRSTAHKVRERIYKSQAKKQGCETERIAEFWNMPEIKGVKNVKHAHLIDKDLNQIASTKCKHGTTLKPVKIVCSPHLRDYPKSHGLEIKPGTIRAWPVESRRKSPRSNVFALDKGANLRVDQRAQRFKGVKYEACRCGLSE